MILKVVFLVYNNYYSYSTIKSNLNVLNFKSEELILTIELYNEYELIIINNLINHITNNLLEYSLIKNSTNKLENIKHEYEIITKQDLLKELKDLFN